MGIDTHLQKGKTENQGSREEGPAQHADGKGRDVPSAGPGGSLSAPGADGTGLPDGRSPRALEARLGRKAGLCWDVTPGSYDLHPRYPDRLHPSEHGKP